MNPPSIAIRVSRVALGGKLTSLHFLVHNQPRIVQDLYVLIAELKSGSVISAQEPNYAVFMRAMQTIQALLDTSLVWNPTTAPMNTAHDSNMMEYDADWNPGINFDPWEFELEFWENLAEHPSLASF